jgi:hypothetical protein
MQAPRIPGRFFLGANLMREGTLKSGSRPQIVDSLDVQITEFVRMPALFFSPAC